MSSRTSAQSSSKSRKLTQLNSIRVPRTLALGLVLLISSALAGAQTGTTLVTTPPGVLGTWNVNYDWSCSANYVQDTITFNPDGTFSDSQGGSGKWSSHDGQILFQNTTSPTRPTKAQLWRVPSWESARHSLAKAGAGTQLSPQPRQNPPRRGRRSLLLPVSHASNRIGGQAGR